MSDKGDKFRKMAEALKDASPDSIEHLTQMAGAMKEAELHNKLFEALRDAAGVIVFAEMAKAYGADSDKFIERAVDLWAAQLDNTFKALDVMALVTKEEGFREFIQESKKQLFANRDDIAAKFRKSIRQIMAGELPKIEMTDFGIPNIMPGRTPEC